MEVLRKGCQGGEVVRLQEELKKLGYPIRPDGVFGRQTYLAVVQFQQEEGLKADGVVGRDTWNAMVGDDGSSYRKEKTEHKTEHGQRNTSVQESPRKEPAKSAEPTGNKGNGKDEPLKFGVTANYLHIEEAAIRAVCEVESGGRTGFLPDGRPMILFEGHIFWRELKKRGINPEDFAYRKEYSDILFPKWNRTSYKGGAAEYERLQRAIAINRDAALCSASWGMFQIMGFNHKLCGFETVNGFVETIKANSNNHLVTFAHFIQNTGMDKPLKALDWAGFAEKYNGPGYKQNMYDEKLRKAYEKYRKQDAC
jgi:hypothetical protein